MAKTQISVTVDQELLRWVDERVGAAAFTTRSSAMEAAIEALRVADEEREFEAALAEITDEDVAEQTALSEAGFADWSEQVLQETVWPHQ
jgi:Arc/MetJ-type ribon-helix-helix transcriptional regulator